MKIISKIIEDLVCTLYLENKSIKFICAKYGISPSYIYASLRRNNIKRERIIIQKYNEEKYCRHCGEKLTSENWYDHDKDKNNICKKCACKGSRSSKIKCKYNLTVEDYNILLESVNNKCEICGSGIGLCVDHNHSTGEIRGILCFKCNSAIGFLEDDINKLSKAIEYLLKEE